MHKSQKGIALVEAVLAIVALVGVSLLSGGQGVAPAVAQEEGLVLPINGKTDGLFTRLYEYNPVQVKQ